MSLVYRTRQFWWALTATPTETDLERARQVLSPELFELFLQMQPSDQAHSLAVLRRLQHSGVIDRDLWTAALLHDVGKSRCFLYPWERAAVVIVQKLWPQKAGALGEAPATGRRRAFEVAEKHAEWGAQMARGCGASPTVVELIRRHQEKTPVYGKTDFERRLILLQSADDER